MVSKDAAAHPDLVGGQASSSRLGDGLLQVGHQADERLIERVNGIAGSAEHRITKQADGTLGHRAILPESELTPILTSSHPSDIIDV
jgi:hypothetical protein